MLPQSAMKPQDDSGQEMAGQADAFSQLQLPDASAYRSVSAGGVNMETGHATDNGKAADQEAVTADAEVLMDVVKETLANAPTAATAAYAKPAQQPQPQPVLPQEQSCQVIINGEPILLQNKKEFIFVDIFDHYLFDLTQSRGRMLITQVNGEDAQYTQTLHPGDKIDIYWKED